jgi:hypothetical protein
MTFHTTLYGFFFRQDAVCNHKAVVGSRMTLDAPHLAKMKSLVGQPFMFLYEIYFLSVSKQLETFEIGVTVQANLIVKGDRLLNIIGIPYVDPVRMRIMALPTGKGLIIG